MKNKQRPYIVMQTQSLRGCAHATQMACWARRRLCSTLGHTCAGPCGALSRVCTVSREPRSSLPPSQRKKDFCWERHYRFTYIINLHHSEILSHPQWGHGGYSGQVTLRARAFLPPTSHQGGAAGLWAGPGPLREALPLLQSWIPARPWPLPRSPQSLGLRHPQLCWADCPHLSRPTPSPS